MRRLISGPLPEAGTVEVDEVELLFVEPGHIHEG